MFHLFAIFDHSKEFNPASPDIGVAKDDLPKGVNPSIRTVQKKTIDQILSKIERYGNNISSEE